MLFKNPISLNALTDPTKLVEAKEQKRRDGCAENSLELFRAVRLLTVTVARCALANNIDSHQIYVQDKIVQEEIEDNRASQSQNAIHCGASGAGGRECVARA